MSDLAYPTVERLMALEQRDLIPTLTLDDPIFDLFPITDDMADMLRWSIKDNIKGLQAPRGLNGDPPKVQRSGLKEFLTEAGVYGEYMTIDERELTKRRMNNAFDKKIDISDLVRDAQDELLGRELDRMRFNAWTLATTGVITITDKDGVTTYTEVFPVQTFTAGTSWATTSTSTPLANLRSTKLLGRGHSVDFGSRAKVYVNQVTANNAMANTNAADLGGKRLSNGATINSLAGDNAILLENGLPQLEVYEGGYINEAGVFTLFIPNNVGVLVGGRPNGAPVGTYRRTFNATSKDTGSYMKIVEDEDDVPARVTVHRGHNGGPIIFYPNAVVILAI